MLTYGIILKGMVIAETKRQMHETLEMKEEEIAQLRSRLQQTLAQKDELQEQKEKSEKAGEWDWLTLCFPLLCLLDLNALYVTLSQRLKSWSEL